MTFKILAIDGGGVRGIIPAVILESIENNLSKPLNESFDLIAGTSTGAMLAAGIAKGIKASELVKFYQNKSNIIFPYASMWSWDRWDLLWKYGPSAPKYSSVGLKSVLESILGNTKFGSITQPKLLITSYDTIRRKSLIFKNWRNKFANIPLWEVCLCSGSAPTYFPAHELNILERGNAQGADFNSIILDPNTVAPNGDDYLGVSIDIINGTGKGQKSQIVNYKNYIAQIKDQWLTIPDQTSVYQLTDTYSAIDGAMSANNPTVCAIAEALRLGANPSTIAVTSIGTGNLIRSIPLKQAQQWGTVQWALPLYDIFIGSSSEVPDYLANQMLEHYWRFQLRLDSNLIEPPINEEIDDSSPENITNLIAAAKAYLSLKETSEKILEVTQFIKDNS